MKNMYEDHIIRKMKFIEHQETINIINELLKRNLSINDLELLKKLFKNKFIDNKDIKLEFQIYDYNPRILFIPLENVEKILIEISELTNLDQDDADEYSKCFQHIFYILERNSRKEN